MNKTELVAAIAESSELSKAAAERVVNGFVSAVQDALKSGQDVTLVGFGTFTVRERAAREGRNPQTGKAIKIKASRVPAFKPGKTLKDALGK